MRPTHVIGVIGVMEMRRGSEQLLRGIFMEEILSVDVNLKHRVIRVIRVTCSSRHLPR